jgi:hypothetical protein
VTFLDDADHVRVFATAILPKYVDAYRERVVEGETTADFVLFEGVVEWLLSRREDDLLDFFDADDVTVAETETNHSFSVVIAEYDDASATDEVVARDDGATAGDDASVGDVGRDRTDRAVGVMFYEDATLSGFVYTDAREAVAWAETRFERLADEAVSLDVGVEN